MASSNNDSNTSSSIVIIDKGVFQCKICYNDFGDVPYVLPCGHSFCLRCIQNIKNLAIRRNKTVFKCPMCSFTQDVNSELKKNYTFCYIRDHMKSTDDLILQSPEYKTLQELNDDLLKENDTAHTTEKRLIYVKEKKIAAQQRVIDIQGKMILELKNQVSCSQVALDCEKNKLSSLIQVDLNAANKEIQKLKEDVAIEKNKAAESQKALKEEIQKLQTDVVFEKDRFAELQEVINCERDLNATICAKLEVLERENGTMKEEVRVLKEKNEKLQADLVFEISKSAEFQKVINRKEELNVTTCAKLEVLEDENEKLKMDIKDTKTTISKLQETINRENEKAAKALEILEQEKQKYINDIAREKNEILERQKAFDYQKEQYAKTIEAEKKVQEILYIPCAVIACFVVYFLYCL